MTVIIVIACMYCIQNCDCEELGRGSFGVVHRAIWRGTSVAAKILPGGHMHGLSDAVSREIAVYMGINIISRCQGYSRVIKVIQFLPVYYYTV